MAGSPVGRRLLKIMSSMSVMILLSRSVMVWRRMGLNSSGLCTEDFDREFGEFSARKISSHAEPEEGEKTELLEAGCDLERSQHNMT